MPVPMMSLRDFTLRSKTGHTVFFPANKPTLVPDDLIQEAMSVNLAIVDSVDSERPAFQPVRDARITGSLRDAIIYGAIEDLVHENEASNFNAGGQPKTNALAAATGLKIGGGEVSKYWERYREFKSTNSPLPTHPRVENVLELQGLSTRQQLLDFGVLMGVKPEMINKKTLREAKEILMYATINYNEAAAASEPARSTLMED